ncbi:MAG TPA: DNA recombination protein RmuC [Holosporales bacterium]|nr:DNA recombination protein RmuC [Holosporales bacterium]
MTLIFAAGFLGSLIGCAFLIWRLLNITAEKEEVLRENVTLQSLQQELSFKLESERQRGQEKIDLLEKAQGQLKEAFDAASAQALERNNRTFLDLAKETLGQFHEKSKGDLKGREQAIEHMVKPLQDALGNVDQKLHHLEKTRESAYQVLRHQVTDLLDSQKELRLETANLVKALRTPHVRGRWGEMQLKRVVEMSGMNAHCDFMEQHSYDSDDGKLRPDMVVNLPGGKQLIIDAKAPLAAYLDAIDARDEASKREHMQNHARQVKKHIMALSKREYWDNVQKADAPEFVVLFLPGEAFFSAALEYDPSLIELGVENRVILATPATLIALLHAVAYGWKQEALSQNAKEISEAGKELYKRMADMGKHFSKLGTDLNTAVGSYNKTVGTMERRILPAARKFKDLETTSQQIEMKEPVEIDHITRHIQAPELLDKSA